MQTGLQAERQTDGEGERRRLCACVGRWAVRVSDSASVCEVCDVHEVRQPRPSHLPVYRSLARLTFPDFFGGAPS